MANNPGIAHDDIERARLVLSSINWNFAASHRARTGGPFDARRHHWYPGTFIPEIPYTLIDVLSQPGEVVCDPFMGIGTTLVQAAILGRRFVGLETCQPAVMFARSLLTLLSPGADLNILPQTYSELRSGYQGGTDYAEAARQTPCLVDRLRPWYEERTFNELMYLTVYAYTCEDRTARAACRVVLSAILKAVCASRERGWGCIADNVIPKRIECNASGCSGNERRDVWRYRFALDRFGQNLGILAKEVSAARSLLSEDATTLLADVDLESCVRAEDSRLATSLTAGSVDLMVTSPPYPNMADYATSQRLSYYWLGADPMDDLGNEIGARRRRRLRNALEQYVASMQESLDSIARALRPGGYLCLVMPAFDVDDSSNSLRKHAVEQVQARLPANSLARIDEYVRLVPSLRRQHNATWATLERETIHVFRKLDQCTAAS